MVAAGVVVVDSVEGVVVAVTVAAAAVDAEVVVVVAVEEDGDVVASPTTLVDVAVVVVPDTNTRHVFLFVGPVSLLGFSMSNNKRLPISLWVMF